MTQNDPTLLLDLFFFLLPSGDYIEGFSFSDGEVEMLSSRCHSATQHSADASCPRSEAPVPLLAPNGGAGAQIQLFWRRAEPVICPISQTQCCGTVTNRSPGEIGYRRPGRRPHALDGAA